MHTLTKSVTTSLTDHAAASAPQATLPPASMNRLFNELVCEHGSRLRRFVTRRIGNEADAADIAQQAFIEASNAYGDFRGDSKLSTWLYGIALNLVRNYLSRAPEQRYNFVCETALTHHACLQPNPEQIAAQREIMMVLSSALESLPENMRQILNLAGMENLSYEQIADILDVPLGTVRSRLSRAARRCGSAWKRKGPCCPSEAVAGPRPATRSSRAAIPGRVPIPAGRVPRCAGGRPGWPRGGMAPPSRNGFSNCGSCAWGTGMASGAAPLAGAAGHDGATPPDCGSRITARLPSTARKPLPPCIRSGTGRPTPPVFIPWRGHGVAERRVRHRHDIRGRRHRDAVNGHQPGPDQEQPLAPLHGLGFAGEQGPRNGMSPSSGTLSTFSVFWLLLYPPISRVC